MHRPFTTVVRAALILAAAIGLTACQGPSTPSPVVVTEQPGRLTGAPTPTAFTEGWQTCTNAARHFSIGYPPAWHTASVGANDACALFDPATFTVVDGAPALVTQQLHAFYQSDDAVDFFMNLFPADFFTVVSRSEVDVAGLHAIRYTVTTLPPRGPSGPTYPVGTTLYGYVVTAGARSIDVGTWAAPTDASLLAGRQHIVDLAVTTVHFL